MSEIAKTFTAAFETVKEHIRYFKSKPDADAAYNGRIVGMEDALSQFRPVMKMIERAALSQPSVTVLVEARDALQGILPKGGMHYGHVRQALAGINALLEGSK